MPKQVLKNVSLWWRGVDLAGQANNAMLDLQADSLECTTFDSDGYREFTGGLKQSSLNFSGYWNAAEPDASFWAATGEEPAVMTLTRTAVIGDTAFFVRTMKTQYTPGLTLGELARFDLQLLGDSPAVRGVLLANETTSSTGALASVDWGAAVAAGSKVYVAIQVLDAGGGSITAKVSSDDDDSWGAGTTDRHTFGAISTDAGYEVAVIDGPITDQYWRVEVTANTGTDVKYVVFFGVLVP